MKCFACLGELEDKLELRQHLKIERDHERALGQSNPRSRAFLALSGRDHDTIGVDVTRRALSDKAG